MPENQASGPKQNSPPPAVEFDPRPAFAVILGFASRVGDYEDINISLAAFVNGIIHETTFFKLQRLVDEAVRHDQEHKDDWQEQDFGDEMFEQYPDEVEVRRNTLRWLADQAFPNGHSYQPLYRLGVAMGDAAFQLEQYPDTKVDLTDIVTAVRSLPETFVRQCEVLKQLGELDVSRSDVIDRFLEVLRSAAVIKPSSPPKKLNDDAFFALRDAIIDDPRFPAVVVTRPAYGANEERDKFIYEERCKGTPHKRIIAAIKQKREWGRINTSPGINNAAARYAEWYGLPAPPLGRGGRPPKKQSERY